MDSDEYEKYRYTVVRLVIGDVKNDDHLQSNAVVWV